MSFVWNCNSGELVLSDPIYRKIYDKEMNLNHAIKAKIGSWTSVMVCVYMNRHKSKVKCVTHYLLDSNDKDIKNAENVILSVVSEKLCISDSIFYLDAGSINTILIGTNIIYQKWCDDIRRNYGVVIKNTAFVSHTNENGSFMAKIYKNNRGEAIKIETTFI
jgi:hypothetical protein